MEEDAAVGVTGRAKIFGRIPTARKRPPSLAKNDLREQSVLTGVCRFKPPTNEPVYAM